MLLNIGLDDTDSPMGGCTTYIAALLVERLLELGARFIDYPNLVRLNPNVPWKTRGNGAVCLRVDCDPSLKNDIVKAVITIVKSNAEFNCKNTNPGIVFHTNEVPESFKRFSTRVIQGIVALDEAVNLIDGHNTYAIGYKNKRGLIGALAAVGERLEADHTYELLTYRIPKNRGDPRRLDTSSIINMDYATKGETFNNFDPEKKIPLIAPHGPDPVLFGVRGESPEAVYKARTMIKAEELIERFIIFCTNQGTDAHFGHLSKLSNLKPFNPAIVFGEVEKKPKTIHGGHVIFSIKDETGLADCAAYEPTGSFRSIVRLLIPGDRVRVYGGVRVPVGKNCKTLNLEKLEVLHLTPNILLENPLCPNCRKNRARRRMESMGRGKGYRCRTCGLRDRVSKKRVVEVERHLSLGLFIPPPRTQRHLTKPFSRYGKEKNRNVSDSLYEPWYWVNKKF